MKTWSRPVSCRVKLHRNFVANLNRIWYRALTNSSNLYEGTKFKPKMGRVSIDSNFRKKRKRITNRRFGGKALNN